MSEQGNLDPNDDPSTSEALIRVGNLSAVYILIITIAGAVAAWLLLGYIGETEKEISHLSSQTIYAPIRSGRVILDSNSASSSDLNIID